jgi:predicted nucleic acid-binding protein
LSFDLPRALRRIRPQRTSAPVETTPADFDVEASRPELLLDTCVYIDVAQKRASAELKVLLRRRLTRHSAVALAELTHLFGRLDPHHPGTASALRELTAIINDIPGRRLTAPTARTLGEAILHLQAAEGGWVLVTRNSGDFSLLKRLSPATEVFLY